MLHIVVFVRRREAVDRTPFAPEAETGTKRRRAKLRALERSVGSSPEDRELVAAFARERGLTVGASHNAFRSIELFGTAEALNAAFGVKLGRWRTPDGEYLSFSGRISVPAYLAGVVTNVVGLDTRPLGRRAAGGTQFTLVLNPTTVADIYGFPAATGAGEVIGILEFGGGFQLSDVLQSWIDWKVAPLPPLPILLSIAGGSNATSFPPNVFDAEVTLDIALAGAVAPGAVLNVYFCPFTITGWVLGIQQAFADSASVISISYGAPQAQWTTSALQAVHDVLSVTSFGDVTILCASGDTSGVVNYPSADPFALGCGGTSLLPGLPPAPALERIWQNSSGGIAPGNPPTWQTLVLGKLEQSDNPSGEVVPDVAGHAGGYRIVLGGVAVGQNGTSAVAPIYAGLIARINELAGRVGHLNPLLYAAASPSLVRQAADADTTGWFPLDISWNAFTGLGSLRATNLLAAIDGGLPLGMVWKGVANDERLYHSLLGQGMWAPQRAFAGMLSSDGPAVGDRVLVWKGASDDQLYWSAYAGTRWAPQQKLTGATSRVSPAVSDDGVWWLGEDSQIYVTDGLPRTGHGAPSTWPGYPTGFYSSDGPAVCRSIVAWRGLPPDNALYWGTYDSVTGAVLAGPIPEAQSDVRPAIAAVIVEDPPGSGNETVLTTLVFARDGLAYYMQLSDQGWTGPFLIPGVFTNDRPTVAAFDGVFYLCWRDEGSVIYWSVIDGFDGWTPARAIPGIASSAAPCLSASEAGLVLAWKGESGDDLLYWSNSGAFSGKQWGLQESLPHFGTSTSAAVATFNGTVVMVWKGVDGDQRLWFAIKNGSEWSAQSVISGATTDTAPACVAFGPYVIAVWKGTGRDETIYRALWDGNAWEGPFPMTGMRTSTSPALAVFNSELVMAWKGITGDDRIWFSTSGDGQAWKTQTAVEGVKTDQSPALAALNSYLLMAWKGVEPDQIIWFNQWDGSHFAAQGRIHAGPPLSLSYAETSIGPALCTVGQVIYMVWKGTDNDENVYSAIWDGVSWSTPQRVSGIGTSFRPALSIFA